MATKIKLTDYTVTLTADCPFDGGPMHEEYSIPRTGGFVRDSSGNQVCEDLGSRGYTLTAETPAELLTVIRREWQTMRRIAAKA